jgi:hypothetical protein
MISMYADFNYREDVDSIVIRLDIDLNSHIPENDLHADDEVILYDETMECRARLRKGSFSNWVAQIIPGTIKDIPEDKWGRLDDKP